VRIEISVRRDRDLRALLRALAKAAFAFPAITGFGEICVGREFDCDAAIVELTKTALAGPAAARRNRA
jgi:hypothetical protein